MKHYCTYFDRNYLTRGVALIRSLQDFELSPYTIHVVCMDELTRLILLKLNLQNVELVPLHELEEGDYPLRACKADRSVTEYLWTKTPTLILRLMERTKSGESITYLDADMLFYSDTSAITTELGDADVMIHRHRFPPRLKHLEEYGIFNVGLMSFRYRENTYEILNWWRKRCIEWCYRRLEHQKFGDQGYLNDWPSRFSGIKVTEHIGIGAAPWNIEQYVISEQNGAPYLDHTPLVLYHFHNCKYVNPLLLIPCSELVYYYTQDYLLQIFRPYADRLLQAYLEINKVHQGFACGLNNTDILSGLHTFVAHQELEHELPENLLPQKKAKLNHDWLCYCSEQVH